MKKNFSVLTYEAEERYGSIQQFFVLFTDHVLSCGGASSAFYIFWRCCNIAAKELSINEQIKSPQVRLIGNDGAQLGILSVHDALNMAYDKGLDLVEISPGGNPPVCKIMDYGKFKFEKEKKEKESKKKQNVIEIKEIKFSCRIGQHDLDTKLGHAHRFLAAGNKVKMTIMVSGREMKHTDLGYKLMEQIAEACSEDGVVEKNPSLDGRFMTMFVAPKTK